METFLLPDQQNQSHSFVVLIIDIQSSGSCGIVYGRILKAFHFSSGKNILKVKELHIHLDAVARNLLLIAFKRFHRALVLMLWKPV